MGRESAAGFGGDDGLLLALLEDGRDVSFAAAVAVDVRRIDEVDPGVELGVNRLFPLLIGDLAPIGADLPGSWFNRER